MGNNSTIEWTTHTFNAWRGCEKVSPGCEHCYAEQLSKRNPKALGEWGKGANRVIGVESYWKQPLLWDRKARQAGVKENVFCASLSDVFEDRPDLVESRVRLFNLIQKTENLNWLLLTKRPQNIPSMINEIAERDLVSKTDNDFNRENGDGIMLARRWKDGFFPKNVWLGTSVEDQKRAEERIPLLLKVKAKVHFVSCEPLLGPVDMRAWLRSKIIRPGWADGKSMMKSHMTRKISWVIIGGESGGKARPMHPDWLTSLIDQAKDAGAAVFFKQWGQWVPRGGYGSGVDSTRNDIPMKRITNTGDNGQVLGSTGDNQVWMQRVNKKTAGRMIENKTYSKFPV